MRIALLNRINLASGWISEVLFASIFLAIGFGLMPLLIFIVGKASLGATEGASAARIYRVVYDGLGAGSTASWIVVLGPYGLYLMFRGLLYWWRAGGSPTRSA